MARKSIERRFYRIREIGCLACRKKGYRSAPDVHHLNLGGHAGQKRRGDEFSIGLCPYHHRGVAPFANARAVLGPSLALEPRRFREVFGSDDALLAWQNRLIRDAEERAA